MQCFLEGTRQAFEQRQAHRSLQERDASLFDWLYQVLVPSYAMLMMAILYSLQPVIDLITKKR